MSPDALTVNLLASAAIVAVVHTALGPDHTLPFVMLSRARRWSLRKTLWITGLCGLGHVASSLVLGGVGVALGASTGTIEGLELGRGDLAAWAMVVFGAVYALWGLRQAIRARRGLELHRHDGDVHLHAHGADEHSHAPQHGHSLLLAPRHSHAVDARSATFWSLFVVFVLGPCEPLIPLFFLPASEGNWALAAWTGAVFCVATLATMLALVALALAGLKPLRLAFLERWTHSLAGAVIAASGLAVLYGGL